MKEEVCQQVYRQQCTPVQQTVLEPYTETECTTTYKEDCEFHWEVKGGEKIWAAVPGSCKVSREHLFCLLIVFVLQSNPHEECQDVEKQAERLVASEVCQEVPVAECHKEDRLECWQVPDQVCKSEPITKCDQVPHQVCHTKHKKIPVRVSRTVEKQVCDGEAAAPEIATEVPASTTTTGDLLIRSDSSAVDFNERRNDTEILTSEKFTFEEANNALVFVE